MGTAIVKLYYDGVDAVNGLSIVIYCTITREIAWELNCFNEEPDYQAPFCISGLTNEVPESRAGSTILNTTAKAKEQKGSRKYEKNEQKHSCHRGE